jgi:hypothetical protein
MSHLIEEYAKSLGVKIGKPVIKEHYYPICHEKYITIYNDNQINSRNYDYFTEVINLIKPLLEQENIKIIQVGNANNSAIKNIDEALFSLTKRQMFFILKNTELHISVDNFTAHISSLYNKPTICLYSDSNPENSKPIWNSEDKLKIIESEKNGSKPSYSFNENPKTIKNIKPEKIAQFILNALNIKHEIDFKTIKIGSMYQYSFVEVVPNFRANLEDQKNNIIYLRADLHFDEENIAFWASKHKVRILTDKIIPLQLLQHFQVNIDQVFFQLKSDEMTNEYFDLVKKLKIKFSIVSDDKDNLSKLRNKFFDFKIEFDDSKERVEKIEKIDSFFTSSKTIISNGKLYPTEYHLKQDKKLDEGPFRSYDDFAFWKDAEHYYFYE